MERCIGITKTKKRCRMKLIKSVYNYFCCENHLPYNTDFFEDGCMLCMEKDINKEDIKILKCNHVIHAPCFEEWKKHSTYTEDICILCRQAVIQQIKGKSDEERGYKINQKKVKILVNYESYNYVGEYIEDICDKYVLNMNKNKGELMFLGEEK